MTNKLRYVFSDNVYKIWFGNFTEKAISYVITIVVLELTETG